VNKFNSIKIKKEAIVKHSFFFLLFFSPFFSFSQEVRIKHYERKLSLEKLILPNDTFNSNVYNLFIPDSIYTAGKITIKSLKIKGAKYFSNFYFNDNRYSKTEYIVKTKNYKELLSEIQKNSELDCKEEKINRRKTKIIISGK
jgi:hypothetical protein